LKKEELIEKVEKELTYMLSSVALRKTMFAAVKAAEKGE
jgi:hypothetical protein